MATEKLWTGFDDTKIMAERAVCDEVGQNIVDTYATKAGVPSVYDAKLKLQLGSGQAADTGFTANASADATLTVPEMGGAGASAAGSTGLVPAPEAGDRGKYLKGDGTWANVPVAVASTSGAGGTDGLMPATDKEKLDGAKSFSTVKVIDSGVTATLPANSLNEDIELVAGDNVTLEAGLVIGGRQYKTVKIGNQVWMAENLDFLPDGIELHEDSPVDADFATAGAWYYGNDKVTAQSRGYGLIYNSEAVDYLESNKDTYFKGWHVPTKADMDVFVQNNRESLRASVPWAYGDWVNGTATNTTGFTAIPCGEIHDGTGSNPPYFHGGGNRMELWSATVNGAGKQYYVPISGTSTFYVTDNSKSASYARSIRLVKDDSTLPNKVRISSDAALEKSIYGTYIAGEQGEGIEGESGLLSLGENSVELYDTFKGVKFGAERAVADREGNVIDETYATKESVDDLSDSVETALDTLNDTIETVSHAGMYDLGKKTESDLNNGKLAIGCGNSNTELTLTTVSALTVLANSGVPNFALLVDNSGNSNEVTVTVKDSTDATTFYQSTAAGNKVSAGKICQITCVGKCWTLAEFEAPA